jgi:predicted DNA-binding transcriptional regulator AlpA
MTTGHELEPEVDDAMLHIPDVVRLTGISESIIKRMVLTTASPNPCGYPHAGSDGQRAT